MNRYLLRTVVVAFSFCLLLPAIAQERKKVGVVLSGGGAKGVAHIGALRVIEEAGIPIDYIVGTSMGSIIGGLYAIGYTPNQLDSMVRSQNWTFLLSDRIKRSQQTIIEREKSEKYVISIPFSKNLKKQGIGGMIKGQNLANLFSDLTVGYHDSIDFNKLPIPFACVSQDLVTGNEVIFHSGILYTSMRASMAIPGVFTPIRQDGMVLIDGGMKNNFPTDVAKTMGAEIIIGVTVQEDLKGATELNSLPEIVGQVVDLICQQNYEQNLALTNTHIKVDVKGYSSASFNASALDTLTARGEQAARQQWQSLLALKEEIGISDSYVAPRHGPYKSLSSTRSFFVHDITFTGIEESDEKWMMSKCNIQENTQITVSQLEKAIAILSGSQAYSNVSYKLVESTEGYQLNFLLEKKNEKNINLGIRFDSEEIASVLLNATTNLKTFIPSKISITGRLSKRYMARVDYTLEPLQMRYLNFSYMYQYNDINIYNQGDRIYNATYNYHLGEFSLSDVWFKNLRFVVGARLEYFDYKDFLHNQSKFVPDIEQEHFISYFGQLHYNTFDKGYFPTKGSEVKLSYSVHTDNFATYNGHTPFSALTGVWSSVVSVTNRFAVIPTVYGRVLTGHGVAYPYFNALGGDTFGRYVSQQLPFAGINNVEIMNNSVVIAGLKARQRMGGNHYLTLSSNLGVTDDNFFDLLSKKCIYGFGVGYGFDSRFGPLEASFNYSNQTEKVGFYVNLGFTF